jgi:hypothetical protein
MICRTFVTGLVLLLQPALLPAAELLPADVPIEQAIDHYIDAELKEAKINPAPLADDAALLRRLTLDLNGRIPTPWELDEYVASKNPDKKIKLVDRLMASPAFFRHQALEFTTLLQAEVPGKRGAQGGGLRDYLQTAFTEKRSWDRIFREIMLPDQTNPKEKGAGEFLKSRVKDLNRVTIDVSSLFFGVNISCAQCHDHPHVLDWRQDHFYGMKSFFARTYEKGGFLGERDQGVVKFIPNKGKEKQAKVMFLSGKVVEAPGLVEVPKEKIKRKDPPGKGPPPAPKFSLRAKLVELALEPEQREFFARAIVNRTWHRLFGRGLVMPLDQMHSANPASHPALLQWLARDVVEHGYDLRRLVRGLVLSKAYARSSRWEGEDIPQDKFFAVAQIRALTPMQMAVGLRLASSDPDKIQRSGPELEKYIENQERSAGRLASMFLQPGDNFQVGVDEAMLFTNNESLLKEVLTDGPGSLVARLKQIAEPEKRVELAVRSVLNRPATADEVRTLADYLQRRQDRPSAANQQMVWALLTSPEFRFNH